MSAISAICIRNEEVDYLFLATDSVSVRNEEILKDGFMLPERLHSLSSKNIYIPHIKTSVAALGSVWISKKIHDFIDRARLLENMDDLILAIRLGFHDYYKEEAEVINFGVDKKNEDFLGAIIISGVSYYLDGRKTENKRARPLLMSRRFMVYKSNVKDCGWINTESDNYNDTNMMDWHHPAIPNDLKEEIYSRNEEIMNQDFHTGALAILRDKLILSNQIYNHSGRTTMVTAGEIHATIMRLNKSDKFGEGLTVSHIMIHRFEDFEEVKDEMREGK